MERASIESIVKRTREGEVIGDFKGKFISGLMNDNAFFVRKEQFDLQYGGKSHIYASPINYVTKPDNMDFLAEALMYIIKDLRLTDYKLAAAPSITAPIITTALGMKLGKEILIVRETEDKALKTNIHGRIKQGDEIILVDDVVTTGFTLIKIAKWLRLSGARVNHAIVPIVSHLSSIKRLEENDIKCHYLVSFRDILDTTWNNFSSEEREMINNEIKKVPID
jgi:orotate phosphoribosyltransferase